MEASAATLELDLATPAEYATASIDWQPEVSQYDDGGAYVVVIDLPRVPSHSLCVCQNDGALTVSGLRPRRSEIPAESETDFCRFSTRVQLPGQVRSRASEVTFWRELLIIRLPK